MDTINWREEILALADVVCAAEGILRTVLSNRIAKDADFLDHLAAGGGCTTDKYFNVRQWLLDNQPKQPLISAPVPKAKVRKQ